MKSKLQFPTSAVVCILLVSVLAAMAQPTPPAMPKPPVPEAGAPAIEPSTGLPVAIAAPAEPAWIDPNWDHAGILTNVDYDGLPVSEVARQLQEQFKHHFDILPMPQTFGTNWGDTTIQLQLKNVRASEVFNAMNLVFENDRTPLRWQLTVNGTRPLVLLRVLPEAAPQLTAESKPPQTRRMVYFVGNLVGDEKSGGMTMEEIVKTVSDLWPAEYGKPEGVIQFHKEAQLLVVNGTPDQLEFIHQTLAALEQKVAAARPKSAEAKDTEELVNLLKSLKSIGDNSK